jgi:hypothetical protein
MRKVRDTKEATRRGMDFDDIQDLRDIFSRLTKI